MGLSKVDKEKALEFYKKAEECYNNKKYKKMIGFLEKASEKGSVSAKARLARVYDQGDGVERDPSLAYRWLYRAALGGDVESICRLGDYYMNGIGTSKNEKEAAKYYKEAANNGHIRGIFEYGVYLYENGNGSDYICKAAEKGYMPALDVLKESREKEYFMYKGKVVTKEMADLMDKYYNENNFSVLIPLYWHHKAEGFDNQADDVLGELEAYVLIKDKDAMKAVIDHYRELRPYFELYAWLKVIFSGNTYKDALNSARKLGSDNVKEAVDYLLPIYNKAANNKPYTVSVGGLCLGCGNCEKHISVERTSECNIVISTKPTLENKFNFIAAEYECLGSNIFINE